MSVRSCPGNLLAHTTKIIKLPRPTYGGYMQALGYHCVQGVRRVQLRGANSPKCLTA